MQRRIPLLEEAALLRDDVRLVDLEHVLLQRRVGRDNRRRGMSKHQ